jgi:outer membrane protein assembly factor BamA
MPIKIVTLWLFLLVCGLRPTPVSGQGFIERITDFFEFDLRRPAADSTQFTPKIVLAPVATYEPQTSLGLGVGAKLLFKFRGSGPETRTSNLPLAITYTLRDQFIFWSGYTVFFNQERYLLKGNLVFSKYPFPYYGTGNTTGEEDLLPITYNNLQVEPLLLRQVGREIFVGGGIRYNLIYGTKLNEDLNDLPAGTSLQDELGSTSLGLEFAATLDRRNNVLYAEEGAFLEFTHGVYATALGSTHDFQLSKLDYRNYFSVSARRPDVLGFQVYTRVAWGDTPPLELSGLGGEERLRGFQEDRFRDRAAVFAQAEYRWQALERIGMVFYGGVGDVFATAGDLRLDRLKYSLGSGLRLKIVPAENLNIRFDYALGLGPGQEANFYLGIAEAF